MEPTKRIVILLVLILLTSTPAQPANKPAAGDISNTRAASCVVKITSDPMVLPLDDATIDYLLHSTGIGGRVTREVLNISPDQVSEMFTIEALAGSAGRILPEPSPRMMMETERMEMEYKTSTTQSGYSRRTPTTIATSSELCYGANDSLQAAG
jgi:hypothetical protein